MRIRKVRSKFAFVPLFALISACGTQHIYPGEPRNARELSMLSEKSYFTGTATNVRRIDGNSVGPGVTPGLRHFAVLPGHHTVEAMMLAAAFPFPPIAYGPFCIEVTTVANRNYELHGNRDADGEKWSMWIEDENSGEIVAATENWTSDELEKGLAACETVHETERKTR